MASQAENDFLGLKSLAERLKLDEGQSEKFISEAMGRLGHKARTMWEDGESDSKGSGGGSFFGESTPDKGKESKPWGYQ